MAGTLNDGDGAERRPRHAHGAGRQRRCPSRWCGCSGKALIDHVLDRLAEAGIARAIVNVHHKADLIEQHLQRRAGAAPSRSPTSGRRCSTPAAASRRPCRGSGPVAFLIHNADSVWIEGVGSNLARLAGAWDEARMDCLMLLALASASHGYQGRGDFALESDGRIRRRRVEQELVPFAFTGVSVAHPRLFDGSPDGAFSLNLVWSRAIAAGRAYGVRMDGVWMHVGTPDALAEAERCLSGVLRS